MNTHFFHLTTTVQELRGENGCPWDKRQTTTSLVKYLRSEFAELLTAIENGDTENLCEELGDLLFLIVMIAQINHEEGKFSIEEVLSGVTEKLIRRHPHVFAGVKIANEQELQEQWQRIKTLEKSKK
jgi:MazG family protein